MNLKLGEYELNFLSDSPINAYEIKIAQMVFRSNNRTRTPSQAVLKYGLLVRFSLYVSVTIFIDSKIIYELKLTNPASR